MHCRRIMLENMNFPREETFKLRLWLSARRTSLNQDNIYLSQCSSLLAWVILGPDLNPSRVEKLHEHFT